MSSSSNDSEDDEVAKKIRLAVCDESISMIGLHLTNTDGSCLTDSIENKSSQEGQRKDHSSRNQGGNDEKDYGNILSTTPGFRAHVSKQLCIILDKKIQESLSDNVWKCTKQCDEKYIGIHLFSNSKVRCCIVDNEMQESIIHHKMDSPKTRKRSESSSSESSLDEKISACVFSQEDITKENALLTGLHMCDQSTKRSTPELMTVDKGAPQKHKKAKNKKKRKKDQHFED